MEKYTEIQLTKSKMDLNIRKMTNHPPSPGYETLMRQQINRYTITFNRNFRDCKLIYISERTLYDFYAFCLFLTWDHSMSSGPISGHFTISDFDEILLVASNAFQTKFCIVSALDNQWLVYNHH